MTRILTLSLFAVCAPVCAQSAQQSFFAHFMEMQPARCDLAELKSDAFKIWLIKQSLSITEVKLKQGSVPLSKITLVSPAGIKAMTDNGIEVFSWSVVEGDMASRLGWNERVAERYAAAKKDQEYTNRVFAADARQKAARAAVEASAPSAATESMPVDPFAKPARPFPADALAEIGVNARLKWPSNYDMQLYEVEKQTKAFATFNLWRKEGIPGLPLNVSSRVLKASWDKWGCNFDMLIYHAKNETEAWRTLNVR
jgi:hypothetical protein